MDATVMLREFCDAVERHDFCGKIVSFFGLFTLCVRWLFGYTAIIAWEVIRFSTEKVEVCSEDWDAEERLCYRATGISENYFIAAAFQTQNAALDC